MVIMGLDPSATAFGYSVVVSGQIKDAGTIKFPKLKGLERVQAVCAKVMGIVEHNRPDFVVIEERIVGKSSSAIVTLEIASIVRYFLWQENVKFFEAHPTSLKKFVAGNGAAKKEEVMMNVLKNFGHTSKDNNEADAIALAMLGDVVYGGRKTTVAMKTQANHIVKMCDWPDALCN